MPGVAGPAIWPRRLLAKLGVLANLHLRPSGFRGFFGVFRRVMERVKGIEPSSSAWEAAALPLSYTRVGLQLRQGACVVKWALARRGANAPLLRAFYGQI